MMEVEIVKLTLGHRELARKVFRMMAESFGERYAPQSDRYLNRLLTDKSFWSLAALAGGDAVGGITAHLLPMTRAEHSELFIYDVAVKKSAQRQGGRTPVDRRAS